MAMNLQCIIRHKDTKEEETVTIRMDKNMAQLGATPDPDSGIFRVVDGWDEIKYLSDPKNAETFQLIMVKL